MNILKEQEELANPPITNYLVGCAAIIFDEDANLVVGERVDFDGRPVRALFGGKPEYNETLAQGLSREIIEELHLAIHPSRWKSFGIREASPGKGKLCLTAFFGVVITKEERARVINVEPHKCKQLIWDRVDAIRERGLWQDSEPEVIRAFSHFFGRIGMMERRQA